MIDTRKTMKEQLEEIRSKIKTYRPNNKSTQKGTKNSEQLEKRS